MDHLNKLEAYVAPWYKDVPHLPKKGQQWLATNIWWIVLTFVIIGAFGLLSLLSVVFVGGALLTVFGGIVGAALGGFAIILALITVGLAVVNVVIGAFAVNPLQNQQKKGWSLLLLTVFISAVSAVISLLLAYDFFSFIRDLLFVALGGYLLFEIREYFNGVVVRESATR